MDGDEVTEGLPPSSGRRRLLRAAIVAAWATVVGYQALHAWDKPSATNFTIAAAFALLFALVVVQLALNRALGQRRLRGVVARMHGSAYLSDLDNLPNRNYMLSELRREMPRARAAGTPFVLIVLSLDELESVAARRGEAFADRALHGLADVLKRFTRTSDFVAHLGGPFFCVMLAECNYKDSFIYLQRVPGSIGVSDGRYMLEVPVVARVYEYDLEALYATDVLREAEEARPLKRKQQARFGAEAA